MRDADYSFSMSHVRCKVTVQSAMMHVERKTDWLSSGAPNIMTGSGIESNANHNTMVPKLHGRNRTIPYVLMLESSPLISNGIGSLLSQ